MMGWAAIMGDLSAGAWLLGGVLYSWQMPHFLSLAYMMRKDYMDGGYRMMPGDAGSAGLQRATAASMRHCVYLEGLCVAAPMLGLASPIFAAEATALNAVFFYLAWQFHQAGQSGNAGKTNAAARKLFLGSLVYLPALLACMVLHRSLVKSEHGCPFLDAKSMVEEKSEQKSETNPPTASVVADQ
jgi:protoheme IX farnesyltransferase